MFQVNEFLAGAGTDAPDVEEENIISRPSMSYDDMWAKTLLETTETGVRISPGPLISISSVDNSLNMCDLRNIMQDHLVLHPQSQ